MASYKLSPEPPGSNESHQIRTRDPESTDTRSIGSCSATSDQAKCVLSRKIWCEKIGGG